MPVLVPVLSSGNLDSSMVDGRAERPTALSPAISAVVSVVSFGNRNRLNKLGGAECPELLIFANRDEARVQHGPDRISPAAGKDRPIAEPSERDKLAG